MVNLLELLRNEISFNQVYDDILNNAERCYADTYERCMQIIAQILEKGNVTEEERDVIVQFITQE